MGFATLIFSKAISDVTKERNKVGRRSKRCEEKTEIGRKKRNAENRYLIKRGWWDQVINSTPIAITQAHTKSEFSFFMSKVW